MFCCCQGEMCNMKAMDNSNNINVNKQEEITTAQDVQVASFEDNAKRTYIISILLVILISMAIIMLLFSLLRQPRKKPWPHSPEDGRILLDSSPATPPRSLANLRLVEKVRRGHYGSVYKATVGESILAVKVFREKNRDYFLNEKDIYTLPHMKNPGIAKYFGSQEQKSTTRDGLDLMLVFSWADNGSLQQYINKNTVSWSNFCQMTKSFVDGLVHLHSAINKNGKFKPSISHRDFNSGNILVKSDLSCCICDMSFAMKLCDSTAEDVRSSGSCLDKGSGTLFGVGSIRYMAPEELDGSLNMKSQEQALKQVDIYALGLVLWELAKRCHDFYPRSDVPAYEQAFERELGLGVRPNYDTMQLLVSRNKDRPLFPDVWNMTNPAVASLRETIEKCWDPEPDARLSSDCVLERICQLPNLWNRYKQTTITNTGQSKFYPEHSFSNLTNTFSTKSLAGIITNMDYKTVRTSISQNGYRRLDSPSDSSEDVSIDRMSIQPHQRVNRSTERYLAINMEKSAKFVAKSTKEKLSNNLNKLLDCLTVNDHMYLNNIRRQHCEPVNLSPSITYFQNSVKSIKNTNLISDCTSQKSVLESYGRPEMWRSGPGLLHMLHHPEEPLSNVVRINQDVPIHQRNKTKPTLQFNSTKNRDEPKSNLVRAIKSIIVYHSL